MKKLYFLFIIFCMALVNESSGQGVYTAIRTGNWSNTNNPPPGLATWDANGIPASTCNNCTIIISTGKTVTLDRSVILKGASTLRIEAGATLLIKSSNQTLQGFFTQGNGTLAAGHNIILDNSGSSKIILISNTSKIDATDTKSSGNLFTGYTAGGYYDGIFSANFAPAPFSSTILGNTKVIGNSFSTSFFGDAGLDLSKPGRSTLSGPASINSVGTLPVDITSFSAILNDDAVNLSWSVDQQIDFDHFEVMRSNDGGTWQTLSNVAAIPTKGVANYSYVDGAPFHGLNYYRLKAVDIDGNFKLSEVALVRGTLINGVQFANPVRNGSLIVSFGADIKSNLAVRLLSTTGQTMQETQIKNPAGSTISLSVGTYAKGIYLLHIKADDGSQKIYKVVVSN